jgi:hypothetical protein
MPRLNFSRPVKVQHSPAHFDIQFIINDEKLDDVGIFTFVCDRLPVKSLGHITPAGDTETTQSAYLRINTGQPRDISPRLKIRMRPP